MSFFAKFVGIFRFSRRKYDGGSSSRGQLPLAEARVKQQAAVQKMRRGVADVSVARQRLDVQAAELQKAMDTLATQAQQSQEAGDSSAAQSAMNRHLIMGGQLSDLLAQRDALAEQESMLISALTELQARASGFNVTVETIAASRTAAEANREIARALGDYEDKRRE